MGINGPFPMAMLNSQRVPPFFSGQNLLSPDPNLRDSLRSSHLSEESASWHGPGTALWSTVSGAGPGSAVIGPECYGEMGKRSWDICHRTPAYSANL